MIFAMNSSIGFNFAVNLVRHTPLKWIFYDIVTILKSISFVDFILLKYLQKEVIG
jgi:hypothetical protein